MKTRLGAIFILFLLIFSCNKDVKIAPPSVPAIKTIAISELTYKSAVSGGIITDYTGPDVLGKGVCWSISSKPEFDDESESFHTSDGIGDEEFTSLIEELEPETTYYIRAYAMNEVGIGYGNQFTFTSAPLPDMLCPESIEVECIEEVPTAYTTYTEYVEAGGTINDDVGIDSDSFTLESATSDNEACPETITRIYTIDNIEGITYSCSQEIIINDTTAPTASNPSPITVGCAEDIPEADITVVTVMADNCTATEDLVVAFVSDVSGDGECPRIITRTYSVTDVCGNSINVTQTINVNSESAPNMICPGTVEVQCASDVPSTFTTFDEYVAAGGSATDADGIDITSFSLVSSTNDGETCPTTITRIYTISDIAGNMATCSQNIVVNDTTNPTASNPPEIEAYCSDGAPAQDITVVTDAADNCSTPTVTFVSDESDGGDCPEVITRIYSITDECGNSITVQQTINLNSNEAPDIDCPPTITVQCAADVPDAYTSFSEFELAGGSATDDDGIASESFGLVSTTSDGATCPETITRIYNVSDNTGAVATCSQIIVIHDTTNPTASNPPDIEVSCADGAPEPDTTVVTDEADNCSTPTVSHVSDASVGGACATITRTYSVTDECGNSIIVTQTITFTNAPPSMTCPPTITVQCATDVPDAYTSFDDYVAAGGSAIDTDDGIDEGSFILSSSISDGATCPETITRTYEVSDNTGAAATCSQIIVIHDTTNPTASNPPDIEVSCADGAPEPDITVVTDEADNCSTPTVSHVSDASVGGVACATITRTYSVTDECGNSINVVQEIQLTPDDGPPTVITGLLSDLEPGSATISGEVVNEGGSSVTERGFCFILGNSGVPTMSDNIIASGSGLGLYSATIYQPSGSTSIRIRAYAFNSEGYIGYGDTITVDFNAW